MSHPSYFLLHGLGFGHRLRVTPHYVVIKVNREIFMFKINLHARRNEPVPMSTLTNIFFVSLIFAATINYESILTTNYLVYGR